MKLNILAWIVVLETLGFAAAALLHSGVPIFGYTEEHVPSEAVFQGLVGGLLALSAYAIWMRRRWARSIALTAHLLGIAGALFGMTVALAQHQLELEPVGLVRLALLIAVLIVLLLWGHWLNGGNRNQH